MIKILKTLHQKIIFFALISKSPKDGLIGLCLCTPVFTLRHEKRLSKSFPDSPSKKYIIMNVHYINK
jgi:hypothetical protein